MNSEKPKRKTSDDFFKSLDNHEDFVYNVYHGTKIVVYNKRVIHYLNDVHVLEYQFGTPVWKALIDKSKFSIYSADDESIPEAYEMMLHAGSEPGFIGLQGHRLGPLSFRNIRIKEL